MKNKIMMYSGVFFSTLILAHVLDNPLLAGIIVLCVFMPSYIYISIKRQKVRIDLLEESCDPEAFIVATEIQYQITGKNKIAHMHLMIDKSAGLASNGQFSEALALLLSLDEKKLKKNKLRWLVYVNNLMLCYDNLHQVEKVQELYHNDFCVGVSKFKQFKQVKAVMLFAKLKYESFNDELETRRQLLAQLQEMKLTKRLGLHLKFSESELAIMEGDYTLATSLLGEIIENGNKLYIVETAKEQLAKITNNSL